MIELVCFLEERSAEEMLRGVLVRLLPENITITYVPFEGKQDLEKQIFRKIKYWQNPNAVFLILRDQDSGNCMTIKQGLIEKVSNAGKSDRTCIRIACCELETFYLGDLEAVEKGLEIGNIARKQQQAKYRAPDKFDGAAKEIAKLTKQKYQKIQGSRQIAPYLKIDGSNLSTSFNVLIAGIQKLISNELSKSSSIT